MSHIEVYGTTYYTISANFIYSKAVFYVLTGELILPQQCQQTWVKAFNLGGKKLCLASNKKHAFMRQNRKSHQYRPEE